MEEVLVLAPIAQVVVKLIFETSNGLDRIYPRLFMFAEKQKKKRRKKNIDSFIYLIQPTWTSMMFFDVYYKVNFILTVALFRKRESV